MNILVACEESQAVTIELRKLGHNAFSCDIIECSGGHPEWHIKQDVLPLLQREEDGNNGWNYIYFHTMDGKLHSVEKWDMIFAFPPCTFMTKAGARWMYKSPGVIDEQRFAKAMKAKEFFMRFYCADCDVIIIENPVPLKCVQLPEPTQKIHPYQFDEDGEHPYTKETCLWIKGREPLIPTTPDRNPIGTWIPSNTSAHSRGAKGGKGAAKSARSIDRSKTFPGIARAMAEQWAGEAEA